VTELLVVQAAALVGAAWLVWPSRPSPRERAMAVWAAPGGRSADSGPDPPTGVGHLGPGFGPLAPDLVMELVACGLRSGLSVADALAASAGAAPPAYLVEVLGRLRLGVDAQRAWARPPPDFAGLARAMVLADLSGAPAASVVSRAAADYRAARREQAELAAARLGVRLVLPLGLAVLPGFVLLAVIPIVLGLAESVLRSGG
jgi:hypothetical protein